MTIALSGATALGAEVIWTRLLGLMLGATVYTFSIILAVFLVGLGHRQHRRRRCWRATREIAGRCSAGARCCWPPRSPGPRTCCRQSLPYWPINPLLSTSPWFTFQIDLVRCLLGHPAGGLLWGASFPLALAAAAREEGDPGRLVGGIYAANTVGAILGALSASA